MMTHLFSLQLTTAIGWTTLHSLWQIAIIWLVFKAITSLFQSKNQVIYVIALMALGASTVWSVQTFNEQYQLAAPSLATPTEIATGNIDEVLLKEASPMPYANTPEPPLRMLQTFIDSNINQIGLLWCIIAGILLIRLIGGWWLAQKICIRQVAKPAAIFTQLCTSWCSRLRIGRSVNLMESPFVREPLTIGFWKPVVLFPLGMLTQLSPKQVEVLLVHELAHIRRLDYLINIFQLIIEVIFFYHPLIHLLSKEIRTRREYACDDLVVRLTSNPILYAQTLTSLQTDLIHFQNNFVMKSIGKDQFTTRILRIAGITPKNNNTIGWPILLALPLLLLLISPESTILATTVENQPAITQITMGHSLPAENIPTKSQIPTPTKSHTTTTISFTDSLPESVVAIVPEKMNVLYIGVDNPVTIAVAGYGSEDLIVRQADEKEGLTISKIENGHYNVTASKPGQAAIKVYVTENGIEKSVGTKWFRVKRIPDPKLTMDGITSRVITGKKLLECKSVLPILENFDFDAYCEVSGYNITILPKGGEPTNTIHANSPVFSDTILNLFRTIVENGGTLFIDDVKVSCPGDTAPRNLGGIAFKVKGAQEE